MVQIFILVGIYRFGVTTYCQESLSEISREYTRINKILCLPAVDKITDSNQTCLEHLILFEPLSLPETDKTTRSVEGMGIQYGLL